MSFSIIPNWLIRDSDLTGKELLVYIALLNRSDRYGSSFPSMKTLAREARCDERTVRSTIKSLEERGVVTVTRRPQQGGRHLPNLYRVALFDREKPTSEGGVQKRTPVGGKSAPQWGTQMQEEVDPLEVDPYEVDLKSIVTDRRDLPPSDEQIAFLRDLVILLGLDPDEDYDRYLSTLRIETAAEAHEQIQLLWADVEHEGREMLAYDARAVPGRLEQLTPRGRRFVHDTAGAAVA